MTGPDNTNTTLLSDKLSLVTHHHLLTRVLVKLKFDDWNYGSWEFFFDQLCDSYDVSKYIHGNPNGTTTSNPLPLTREELKVDKIILSCIFSTLSDPLQNELRSVKLGDLSMEAYFQKIESVMTILSSLDSPVSDEDVVHYVNDGLPEKYNQVCGYMHYKDTFPDFKTARSLLITEEMRLKSKSPASPVDSSSTSPMSSNSADALLIKLLDKLGVHDNGTHRDSNTTPTPSNLVAYTATVTPAPLYYSAQQVSPYSDQSVMTQPANYVAPPPGFAYLSAYHQLVQQSAHPTAHASLSAGPTIPYQPAQSPNVQPQSAHGAWHMDTGASSHLNNSVTSLTTIFNSCMYPSVSDFLTRWVLLRCDSTGDLYPVTAASPIPHAFLVSQDTWHQRLGHPGSVVLRRLVSSNLISCNKEKPPVLCHACQLDKHCDHDGEFDNRALHKLFAGNGIQFRFSCAHTSQQNVPPTATILPTTSALPLASTHSPTSPSPLNSPAAQHPTSPPTAQQTPSHHDNPICCPFSFHAHSSSAQTPAAAQSTPQPQSIAGSTLSIIPDPPTNPTRYKARLVANDCTQIECVDVDGTFSPVVKPVVSLWAQGTDTAYMLLYVDDVILTASSKTLQQHKKYDVEILERADMVNSNPCRTPVDTESKLGDTGDIVGLHMHDPRKPHFSALKRILRYVRGILDYGLQLFSSSITDLVAYTDAD
nr:ribonuclease H-like domain-containing protein [Tanacetum cinerariifolium]